MAATKPFAIVAGVGPGTGASIARRFAKAYSVVVLARNPANYESVVDEINSSGGQATGFSADLSDPQGFQSTFEQITKQYTGSPLAAAVFNSGGGLVRKPFLELTAEEFSSGFESQGKGAFNFAKATLPLLLQATNLQHPPTLIFTGATASIKGSAQFASFAAGKFALRALAQSLAREFGPQGVHVSHVIVDGVIDIPRTKAWTFEHEDAKLDPEAIAESYWHLHTQPRTTFGFELDLRPYVEKW
ncbi:oxidoreductase, short chain dehydrogenase/reductase family [Aspergillus saccharolyticus JOP 1030-1]|uniref:Oxidoreductase n=1 Tax=Aspergillus saccharolyticus JOP 1030-1 TaxID=1450539 RepID=A0A318ZSE4_9EURO|nr:oxidoreductase [Aspergillus saccharolyticus JOP 1030-1]PYH49564.1 oxidoreductase [Aspergillus saccharolyticus JOP 1030-1]